MDADNRYQLLLMFANVEYMNSKNYGYGRCNKGF